uniref:Bulb-type lectin domain-containing protein n=1 Tax=candidate division WOR-3 bacterium TaxID=2052148 RepID=A0A7V5Y0R1_UNCW3
MFSLLLLNFFLNWERTIGGEAYDEGRKIIPTFDSSYLIVGSTASFGQGLFDIFLIKINEEGETLWTRTYGGGENDYGYDIIATPDSHYLVVGSTSSFGQGGGDVYLLKIDGNGQIIWQRTYGGIYSDGGLAITFTYDSCYVISGYTKSFSNNLDSDLYLLKVNQNGELLWERGYGLRGFGLDEFGYCVRQTKDSGFIIVGYGRFPNGHGVDDIWLLKTDSEGETLFTKIFGGELCDYGYFLIPNENNEILLIGYAGSFNYDVYLIKTDSLGNALWQRNYGGSGYDIGYAGILADNNYLIVGSTESFGQGQNDVYLVVIDNDGNLIFSNTFGGRNVDKGYSITKVRDGNFLIVGYTLSFGQGSADVYLIKFSYPGTIKELVREKPGQKEKILYNILGQKITNKKNNLFRKIFLKGGEK